MDTVYTLKLISWNVNNRTTRVNEQVEALGNQEPDIVALQDVNINSVSRYEMEFTHRGLPHVVHTFEANPESNPTGVLIASRFALNRLPSEPPSVLWPKGVCSPDPDKVIRHWIKRTLFVTVQGTWGEIDLYNSYITPGSHTECIFDKKVEYPWLKIDLLSGVYQSLSQSTNRLRILCGDFNTPQEEQPNGEIVTWGYKKRKNGSYRLTNLDKHLLELNILRDLGDNYDLPDVYR